MPLRVPQVVRSTSLFAVVTLLMGLSLGVATASDTDPLADWSVPLEVSVAADESGSYQPAVAVSGDGSRAITVWSDGGWILASSSADGGASWSSPVQVAGGSAGSLRVALSPDGAAAMVVYLDRGRLVAARSADLGATWSPAAVLPQGDAFAGFAGGEDSEYFSAVPGSDAATVAYWTWDPAGDEKRNLQVSTSFDWGSTWTSRTVLEREYDLYNEVFDRDVVISADGRAVSLLYTSQHREPFSFPEYRMTVVTTTDAGDAWTEAVTLAEAPSSPPMMAGSHDGQRLVLAWQSGTTFTTRASVDGGGTWGGAQEQQSVYPNDRVKQLVSSPDGMALVAYGYAISASSDGGQTWSAWDVLERTSDTKASRSFVFADTGEVTAVWEETSGFVLTARSLDGGASWPDSPDVGVLSAAYDPSQTTCCYREAWNPAVAAIEDGSKIIAVWEQRNYRDQKVLRSATYPWIDPDADPNVVIDPAVKTAATAFDDSAGTSGEVTDSGGLTVSVADAADPADGVVVTVGEGSGEAVLSVCGSTVTMEPGTEAVLTCGSVIVETLTGLVRVVLDDGAIVIEVPAENSAEVSDTAEGATVEVLGGSTDVVASVNGGPAAKISGSTDISPWTISDFERPVDPLPVLNKGQAGRAVPLRWHVADSDGIPITTLTDADVAIAVSHLECGLGSTPDVLEETYTGGSGLQHLGGGDYLLKWKTSKSWGGSCKTMTLTVGGANTQQAYFSFL